MTDGTGRTADGQYVRTVEMAERNAEAARLHATGWSYTRLAERYKVSKRHAIRMVQDALAEAGRADREHALALELAKLDGYEATLLEVLARHHIVVSNGRVMTDPRSQDLLLDDGPVMAAVAGLLRLSERRAKMLGLDAPARQTVTVVTEDVIDAEIARLQAELGAGDAAGQARSAS